MKCLLYRLSALPVLVAFGMAIFPPTARGQIYDKSANFVTIVEQLSSTLTGAKPGAQKKNPSPIAHFSGSPYRVGPTVTPTTTAVEAEEHIAVAPTNSSDLVAAISDFSQRGGFNTTKFAVSTDNGTTWTESFVPEVGGLPATSDGQVWLANSDPVVAIDNAGRVFLADLYIINATGTGEGFYVCNATLPSVAFTVELRSRENERRRRCHRRQGVDHG